MLDVYFGREKVPLSRVPGATLTILPADSQVTQLAPIQCNYYCLLTSHYVTEYTGVIFYNAYQYVYLGEGDPGVQQPFLDP